MKNSNQILRVLLIGGLVLSALIAKPSTPNNGSEILDTEKTIKSFGQSLKTSADKFKPSYVQKKSSIKEILPSVFIHTSMASGMMKSYIVKIAESVKYSSKFPE